MATRDEDWTGRRPAGSRQPRHLASARHPHTPSPRFPEPIPAPAPWRRRLGSAGFHTIAGVLTVFFLTIGSYETAGSVLLSIRGVETTAVVESTGTLEGARAPIVWADLTWRTPAGVADGSVMDHDYRPGQQIRIVYDPHWADNVDNAFPLARRMLLPLTTLGMAVLVGGFWFRFRTQERREVL